MGAMSDDGATSPFRFGVASGDVTHDAIVLWTKLASPGEAVLWRCERVDGVGEPISGEQPADPTTGSVHVAVTGLVAGVQYRYWFDAEGVRSPEGLFRTIPVDRAVRFAVVSCAKFNSGFFNAYRAVAERDDLDFVLHLGDYIYEAAEIPSGKQTPGANIGRPMDPLTDCVRYEDYDRRYALYRTDSDLLHLHARHAMIATIDDHELSDNAWLGGAQEHDPAKLGPWEDRWKGAMRAWSDWMPTLRHPETGDRVWQTIDLGEAGRILLCETRLARTDPEQPDGPGKTALGAVQREAVLEQLATPNPGWTFLAVPSMLSDLEGAVGDEEALFALHKLKMAEADSTTAFHDLWDAFATEQAALVEAVGAADRTVVLSGDVHFSAEHLAMVSTGEFVEWTVTSITSPNLDDKMGWPRGAESRDYEKALLRNLPNLRWLDLDSHGFLIVEAGEQLVSCQWWFVDEVRSASDAFTMGHEIVRPAHPEGTLAAS